MDLPHHLHDLPPRLARLCLGVEDFLVRECGHAPQGVTWLVGFSGGPDSTALLVILQVLAPRLGAKVAAAHLDHGLRPESGAEAEQAAAVCRSLGIPCTVARADVAALAREQGRGLEDAGRQARHAFFGELRQGRPDIWVALGHQLDDLATDQLMRLSRGAGWPALGGMAAIDTDRRLVRPLLLTPRSALVDYVTTLGLPVSHDPSNDDPAFTRNRLAQGLLAGLATENPRHLEAAARLWRQARLDETFFETVLPVPADPAFLPAHELLRLHPALRARLYRRAVNALGPGQALADTLRALDAAFLRRATGRRFQFPGGKTARITRQGITFARNAENPADRRSEKTTRPAQPRRTARDVTTTEAHPVNILIFGPNGSGKGTQGSLIKQKYHIAHIESGAIFREHIGGGTELGKKAKAYIDKGELVPDDITIPMVLETLKTKGADGWLLDGFPRNMVQAEKLWEALRKEGLKLDYVIEILLPREVAKNRIMGRRLCVVDPNHPNNIFIDAIKPNGDKCRVCGADLKTRSDDQDEAAIAKRHDIYYDTKTGTLAAAHFYKALAAKGETAYIALNGEGSIDSIKEELLSKLA